VSAIKANEPAPDRGISSWVWLPLSSFFITALVVSVLEGFAVFGKLEGGRYFVYRGSRSGAAGLREVTPVIYRISEIANWVVAAFLLAVFVLWIRSVAANHHKQGGA
jgi:hypothetical protein